MAMIGRSLVILVCNDQLLIMILSFLRIFYLWASHFEKFIPTPCKEKLKEILKVSYLFKAASIYSHISTPYTVFTGISAVALMKYFTPQMQYGVYLEGGRDEIISPSDLWSRDFCFKYLFT